MRTIHKTLHLQQHHHTGRLLHHKHTSYRGLAVVLVVAGAFIVGLNMVAHATADSMINVSLTVPAPIPADPPIITDPIDGDVTTQAHTTVSGTCPVITPNVIVAIFDNGTMAGSAPCDSDHTFDVSIPLVPGSNALVARVYTITYDAGQSSNTITITYNAPSGSDTTPPGGNGGSSSGTTGGSGGAGGSSSSPGSYYNGAGSNSSDTNYGTGVGAGSGSALLNITIDKPFVVFGPQAPAVWSGSITGGVLTYHVHIDWGDDGSNVYTVTRSGHLDFTHRYSSMQPHTITFNVSDANGQSLTRQYAAVTPYVSPTVGAGTTTTPPASIFGQQFGGYQLVGLYGAYLFALAAFGYLWVRNHHEFAFAKVPTRGHRTAVRTKAARRRK